MCMYSTVMYQRSNADERAVAPLLKFLKTTGVGGREGAMEREQEWERKNDQESEKLLG